MLSVELRRINAIVASCWIYFTMKHDARNHKYCVHPWFALLGPGCAGDFWWRAVPVVFSHGASRLSGSPLFLSPIWSFESVDGFSRKLYCWKTTNGILPNYLVIRTWRTSECAGGGDTGEPHFAVKCMSCWVIKKWGSCYRLVFWRQLVTSAVWELAKSYLTNIPQRYRLWHSL